ncbi:MAG: S8 family serine peptidase [Bacteroidales bacterium]|jgi:hypothetical protein|nr:S8 family serine peptidase [Bacteroidales bacterium]
MKRLFAVLILSFSVSTVLFSQVETNMQVLEQFAKEKEKEWKKAAKRVKKFAKENGIEKRKEFEDGKIIELVDVKNGMPVYFVTDNADAAVTTRANELWPGGTLGIEVTGSGFDKVAIWDGGSVRVTHQEFNDMGIPRVTLGDSGSQSAHATHVAGTIVAGGVDPAAQGMAYEAKLRSYIWDYVISEMATAAADGMLISNHSWGYVTGWHYDNGWQWYGDSYISEEEDYNFGYYSDAAQEWDMIAKNAPYFLMVKAAGNDRGDGPNNAGSSGVPEKDGGADGYDCISSPGTSKNILTVGAVEKVMNYTKPGDVKMTYFSGWGPTDDGRIKPDVVAAGYDLYSSISSGDSEYDSYSGTSMSSPNATGTLVLLIDYYQQLYGENMLSSTLKGLVIHTADECGPAEGPDYMYGWGLVNAQRAAEVIQQKEDLMTISEIQLNNGEEYTRHVASSGNEPLRVTICWTDAIGPVYNPALNNRAPVLVNDLDLRVVDEQGNTFYPYKLDPDNPSTPATKDSKNYVDNVEHLYIAEPQGVNYTIIVDHAGTLRDGKQVFSLIISGIGEYSEAPECTSIKSPEDESSNALVNQEIVWRKADFATSYEVYFGTDGNGTDIPTNIYNGTVITDNYFQYDMEPATTYYLAIHPGNDYGTNTQCNTIYSFTTYSVDEIPYFIDLEHEMAPEFPEGWQSIDNGLRKWEVTNEERFSGRNAFACMVNFAQIEPMDNMLITPPIAVTAEKKYDLKFHYRVYQEIPEVLRVVWGTYPTSGEMKNKLFFSDEVTTTQWEELVVPIEPETDGYIYIGIHLNSPEGSGLLLDDILLEYQSIDDINDIDQDDMAVHYDNGYILFNCKEKYGSMEISVFNMLGQKVLEDRSVTAQNGKIRFEAVAGVYVVNFKKEDGQRVSKKIVVN